MSLWRCVCGYVHDGEEAPQNCPKCGAPKEKFQPIGGDEAALITRSRLSNQLHMRLASLMDQVEELADEGIVDNLDPGCLGIFQKAKDSAVQLRQAVKAEIRTHLSKSKWG